MGPTGMDLVADHTTSTAARSFGSAADPVHEPFLAGIAAALPTLVAFHRQRPQPRLGFPAPSYCMSVTLVDVACRHIDKVDLKLHVWCCRQFVVLWTGSM